MTSNARRAALCVSTLRRHGSYGGAQDVKEDRVPHDEQISADMVAHGMAACERGTFATYQVPVV